MCVNTLYFDYENAHMREYSLLTMILLICANMQFHDYEITGMCEYVRR